MSQVSSPTRSGTYSLLLKVAGFALAAATALPAAAVPVIAAVPFALNATSPTASASFGPYSTGNSAANAFTVYYSFQLVLPATDFGISMSATGTAAMANNWAAEVYESDSSCLSTSTNCNIVGSAFATLTRSGNSLYLPSTGFGTVTAPTIPGTYLLKVTGTWVAGKNQSFNGTIASDAVVPAPAALGLLGIGLLGMGLTRRRNGAAAPVAA